MKLYLIFLACVVSGIILKSPETTSPPSEHRMLAQGGNGTPISVNTASQEDHHEEVGKFIDFLETSHHNDANQPQPTKVDVPLKTVELTSETQTFIEPKSEKTIIPIVQETSILTSVNESSEQVGKVDLKEDVTSVLTHAHCSSKLFL